MSATRSLAPDHKTAIDTKNTAANGDYEDREGPSAYNFLPIRPTIAH
jgi:hypothetical protein